MLLTSFDGVVARDGGVHFAFGRHDGLDPHPGLEPDRVEAGQRGRIGGDEVQVAPIDLIQGRTWCLSARSRGTSLQGIGRDA